MGITPFDVVVILYRIVCVDTIEIAKLGHVIFYLYVNSVT